MRLMKKYILLPLVALFLFVANATAQIEFPEDKVSWKFSIEQDGCNATIIAKITCVEHWHVYAANLPPEAFSLPTEVEPEQSSNYTVVGKVLEPKPEFYHDDAADEDIYQHSNSFTLKRKIKISSKKDFTLKGRFSFQTCDETHCLPPFDTGFELKVKGCEDEEVTEEAGGKAIENSFESVNGDEAKGKDGAEYVRFEESWVRVPEGNSVKFYKKYLSLGGSGNE
ncbi:MAG: hypothetical protein COB15_10175 [Flavobacteriales bacterium]|nr:MAG: hypothetical protein COB15_10175 [Flavobacteriales bacterium]